MPVHEIDPEMLAFLATCTLVGFPAVMAVLWKLRARSREHKAREAMRRGNKIYEDWRRRGNDGRK